MKGKLCLIKLGGSVITKHNTPNTVNLQNLSRLINEVAKAHFKGVQIILAHGSGSFSHFPSLRYKINEGLTHGNSMIGTSITQEACAKLHRVVVAKLIEAKVPVFSFSPSSAAMTRNGKIVRWDIEPIKYALKKGFMPVTYGDVHLDYNKGVADLSTEDMFLFITGKLKPQKVIAATDVDGLFTSNPKLNSNARLVNSVTRQNIGRAMKMAGASTKVDVTGGMKGKLASLYKISSASGGNCYILNANSKGRLYDAVMGKRVIGTRVNANI